MKKRTIYGVLHLLASVLLFILCVGCIKQMMRPEIQVAFDSLSSDDPVWIASVASLVALFSGFFGVGLFSDGMKLIFFEDRSGSPSEEVTGDE